ncbi:MAG: class I SAM-dependent methyltransferase [Pseudomonadota bacterium]
MTTPSVPTAYRDQRAQEYDDRRFTSPAGLAIAAAESALFRAALGAVPAGAHLLEVGCGTGRFLLTAFEAGFRCEGLDPSPDMLELVRGKLGKRATEVTLRLGEGAQLPYTDGAFDFTYSIRVLNQVGRADYALAMVRDLLRVVRPGGLVLIEFANRWRPHRGGPDVRLSPAEVLATAATAGGRLRWLRGTFALGMTAYWRAPGALLPMVSAADRALSRAVPRLCARCYALIEKA